jgi:hypothetical protein
MITKYENFAEAKVQLINRGYKKEYTYDIQKKCCRSYGKHYSPNDLLIIEYHRFQGAQIEKNPSIIIALEDSTGNKGILIGHDPLIRHPSFIDFLHKVKIKLRSNTPRAMKSK